MRADGAGWPKASEPADALRAADSISTPPGSIRLLIAVLDALEALRNKRLPWSVVATNLCVEDDKGRLYVDLIARFDAPRQPRPFFVAFHTAAGADAWWFARHPQCDQRTSRPVFVDEYVIREQGVEQYPIRLGHGRPEPFSLAAAAEGGGARGCAEPGPVDVAVGALRAQDVMAQKWLPSQYPVVNRAGDKSTVAVLVVSVILTDRTLYQHPAMKAEDPQPGAASAVGQLEWLWFECGSMRPALVPPKRGDVQVPYGYDFRFTRDVAVARVGSLEALLTSDGWPEAFF